MKKVFLLGASLILLIAIFKTPQTVDVFESENDIKYVAFTFDDGPTKYTDTLLDELQKRGVKATFFLLGCQCEKYQDSLKRIVTEGHQIGNHGYDHQLFFRLKQEEIEFQINETNNIIEKITGTRPEILRPAYGAYKESMLENINMPVILWSIDTRDWKVRNAKKIYENSIEKIKDGDIILFHDKFASSIEAALMLIDELKEDNFEFLTISELMAKKDINYIKAKEYLELSYPVLKNFHTCP